MTLTIAGAGLAGLLAGNMLARRRPRIVELQQELPNNHSAVLRFRSSIIGDTLGITFKKVSMIKASLPWRNPIADALAYSFKNIGELRSDRSIIAGHQIAERWIAPPDLIPRMAESINMICGVPADFNGPGPFISTLPMPVLMDLLDYPARNEVEFRYQPATNIKATIPDCDAYVSLLVPDPAYFFSRLSLSGNELTVEVPGKEAVDEYALVAGAAILLGLPSFVGVSKRTAPYSKLLPIPEDRRREFLFWATDQCNVFSLGRFATWRPGLLMDDLVKDLRLIDGWLDRKNRYSVARHR